MKKLLVVGVAALALATGLAACSSSTPAPSAKPSSASGADPALVKLVPKAIESQGTINGGANFQAPPLANYDTDGKTPSGAVVKLVEHASALLGLTVNWQQILYPDQIPAMQAKKIVISGSASGANADIIASANVVGMFYNQQGILALPAKAKLFKTVDDMCGKSIGLGQAAAGTIAIFDKVADKCKADGKDAPKKTLLSATADIVLAVQSGRIDGGMIPTPTVIYTAQQSGGKLVATSVGAAIAKAIPQGDEGFTLAKDQLPLAKAYQAAFNTMMKDGSYVKIMKQFGVPSSQFRTTATLNKVSS